MSMPADESPAPSLDLPVHLAAASGLLMGAADAVPGVSGGTIALIIGIYDRFIEALSTMVRAPLLVGKADGRAQLLRALRLLVPLGLGLLASYYVVTKILVGPKGEPGVLLRPETAPICYSFFFGLVLVSLREPWRRIEGLGWQHFVAAALGAAAAAAFVGMPHHSGEPPSWALALGGAGAIAVMLLPGVSGSLLLVILGQYATVAGAIHDRAIGTMAIFAGGIGLGIIGFVPFLRYLLRHHHNLTMAALTGLMAGSLRALWPWKDNYDPKGGPMTAIAQYGGVLWPAIALLAGAAVVFLLARLETRILEQGRTTDEVS